MTVTEGMSQATTPGLYHTAEGAHLEGIDFAGKTGTAQVVGGGDTHNKGGAKTPNAWFVGMVPRRDPEIAVVVLQEHGDWGSGSAKIAAQIITAYVNKKRKQDRNVILQADKKPAPVEMGAVWSTPEVEPTSAKARREMAKATAEDGAGPDGLSGGRFLIEPETGMATTIAAVTPVRIPAKAPQVADDVAAAVPVLPERFRGVIR
jgi:penicillin-binding protein 2